MKTLAWSSLWLNRHLVKPPKDCPYVANKVRILFCPRYTSVMAKVGSSRFYTILHNIRKRERGTN